MKERSWSPQKTVAKPMYFNKLLTFVCIRMALSHPNQKQKALQKSWYKYSKMLHHFWAHHPAHYLFILSIPLCGRKVSSSCCSGGCKRDDLFIPTFQKIYRSKRNILCLFSASYHPLCYIQHDFWWLNMKIWYKQYDNPH